MTSSTSIGRLTGALLLVQLVTGLMLPYILLHPVSARSGAFLDSAEAMEGTIRLSVLMLVVGAAVSLVMAIALWSAVRDRHPQLGLWLVALAVINVTLQLIENAHWLTLLSVSQAYSTASANADAGLFPALAPAVYAAFRWAHYSHILVVVGWLFTLFLLMARGGLAPRALALLGMGGALLHFIGITLPAFGGYRMPYPDLFGIPLAVAIVLLALWLIAKGLSAPTNAEPESEPA